MGTGRALVIHPILREAKIDDGMRRTVVPKSAEFRVQRFPNVSAEIRDCNPMGILITDYEILGTE